MLMSSTGLSRYHEVPTVYRNLVVSVASFATFGFQDLAENDVVDVTGTALRDLVNSFEDHLVRKPGYNPDVRDLFGIRAYQVS